jgi:hypothetical protein
VEKAKAGDLAAHSSHRGVKAQKDMQDAKQIALENQVLASNHFDPKPQVSVHI